MKKKYVFEMWVDDNDRLHCKSRNDGFNALELAGMMSFKHRDIIDQLQGKVEPETVKSEIVE